MPAPQHLTFFRLCMAIVLTLGLYQDNTRVQGDCALRPKERA